MTSTTRSSIAPALLMAGVMFALAWSVAFVPIRADNDCWWHVKTGKYISEHGIPSHDVFSFTAEDHKWDNHEWLTEVAMWQMYRLGDETGLGGWRAVILLTALLSMASWAAVAWLAGRRVRYWPVALFVAIWAIAIGRRTLYPRPPVVTYALFAIFLWILYEVRLRRWPRKRLAWLVPLTALWSNLHGGWMAGLVAVVFFGFESALATAFDWWRQWRAAKRNLSDIQKGRLGRDVQATGDLGLDAQAAGNARLDFHRKDFIAYSLVFLGCVAASCANPFGWRLYLLPARVMKDPNLTRLIGELQPPNLFYTVAFLVALLAAGAGFALVRRRPVALPDALLFLFWGWQAGQHVRHLPMFAVAAAPLLAVLVRQGLADFRTHPAMLSAGSGLRRAIHCATPWAIAAAGAVLAVYVALNPREADSYPARNRDLLRGTDYIAENYPAEACDFVLANDIRGRLFNLNHYAGYLIWRLSPEHTRVFTDSRFDIFGGRFIEDEYVIRRGAESAREGVLWQERLDAYKIDWILIPDAEPLNERLSAHPEAWELVYRDGPWSRHPAGFSIWIRVTPETQAMRDRCRRALAAMSPEPKE